MCTPLLIVPDGLSYLYRSLQTDSRVVHGKSETGMLEAGSEFHCTKCVQQHNHLE